MPGNDQTLGPCMTNNGNATVMRFEIDPFLEVDFSTVPEDGVAASMKTSTIPVGAALKPSCCAAGTCPGSTAEAAAACFTFLSGVSGNVPGVVKHGGKAWKGAYNWALSSAYWWDLCHSVPD